MNKLIAAFTALATLTVAVAGSSAMSGATAAAAARGVRIGTRNVPGLGQILVNAEGKTLYIFVPDKHAKVTCFEECAEIWPPVFLGPGQKPTAAGKVKKSLLASDPDPSIGERVVTYHGWPLYTYVTDTGPGQATGQATNLNGGLWYVISPSGTVIKKALKHS